METHLGEAFVLKLMISRKLVLYDMIIQHCIVICNMHNTKHLSLDLACYFIMHVILLSLKNVM